MQTVPVAVGAALPEDATAAAVADAADTAAAVADAAHFAAADAAAAVAPVAAAVAPVAPATNMRPGPVRHRWCRQPVQL